MSYLSLSCLSFLSWWATSLKNLSSLLNSFCQELGNLSSPVEAISDKKRVMESNSRTVCMRFCTSSTAAPDMSLCVWRTARLNCKKQYNNYINNYNKIKIDKHTNTPLIYKKSIRNQGRGVIT